MFRKILLGSDGSDCAFKAAEAAAAMAGKFGSALAVVHVYGIPSLLPAGSDDTTYVDPVVIEQAITQANEAVAQRTGEVLEKAGVDYVMRHEVGHAAEVIVRIAESEGFDLIVLGSRGMSAIKGFLLGSVSDRVTHHAHCPVLIVK